MTPVGPVLQAGDRADAVVAALKALNAGVIVVDRGAYLRVIARRTCTVTRAAIEAELGIPFRLPGDLERIMPSLQGRLEINEEQARWLSDEGAP
jgi:hypothetical protein